MKKKTLYLSGLLMVMVLSLGISSASGFIFYTSPSVVEIDHASYLDIDGDGLEDDLFTVFTIHNPYIPNVDLLGELRLYMQLPSGYTWLINIPVDYYLEETWTLHVEWHNCATEPGWYDFYVYLDVYAYGQYGGMDYLYESDYLEFDPPEEDGYAGAPMAYYY